MLRLTMMTQEGEVVIGELTKTGCAAKWAFGMDMQRDGRSIQRWRRFPPGWSLLMREGWVIGGRV